MAISSILKTLTYISHVSLEPLHIELDGKEYDFPAVIACSISESFWMKDSCNCCGICCGNFDTVFTENEFTELQTLANASENHAEYVNKSFTGDVVINGVRHTFKYSKPLTKSQVTLYSKPNRAVCRWGIEATINDGLDKSDADTGNGVLTDVNTHKIYCKLHQYRPITCGFPHMELYGTCKSTVSHLGHKQYGRNHQLGCTVNVKSDIFNIDTLNSNIYWLQRLQSASEEWGIKTLLPNILKYLYYIRDRYNETQDVAVIPVKSVLIQPKSPKSLF